MLRASQTKKHQIGQKHVHTIEKKRTIQTASFEVVLPCVGASFMTMATFRRMAALELSLFLFFVMTSHNATRRLECYTWPRINNNSRPRFINEEEGQTHKISCIISFKTHIRSQRIFSRHIFMSRALPEAIPHIRCKSSHFLDYRIRPTTDHVLMLHTANIQKHTGLKPIHTTSSRVD